LKTLIAIVGCLFLATCSQPPSVLEQILRSGELRVVTRNLPTAYYLGAAGPQGPEYDLAVLFAESLGVRLYIYSVPNSADVLRELEARRAHIAAAGLTRGHPLPSHLAYGPPYQQVREHLIFRMGAARPRDILAASRGHIEVVAGSVHAHTLDAFRARYPNLTWVENPNAETEELLYRLTKRELDYTIADSNEFAISRAFHPEIRVAFDLNAGKALAWVVDGRDASLVNRVAAFFTGIRADGTLTNILDTYYANRDQFDYVQTRSFIQHVETRLPQYRQWFKDAAEAVGVDWRLLAAIGYQESQWDPMATSFTGARGLMMLTEETARLLDIADRTDPRASIFGAARYFARIRSRIPARIPEPDRTWMALAAYNVGLGHLEDARILTQWHGKNPDLWADVREHLPLLTQEKWYTRVKRGYARGWEPVHFVDNIRGYCDILDWVAADTGRLARRELPALPQ
jgi:membrane-bound lytic murein transglycosylase F